MPTKSKAADKMPLVKVLRPITKLTSWPVVADGTVAVALVARVSAAATWTPAAVRLAQVRLLCCRRVAPVSWLHAESCDRGVEVAVHSSNGAALGAIGSLRAGERPIVVLGADAARRRTVDRIATDVAWLAHLIAHAALLR
eukprot:2504769-Prymnesium_polylepis.1